MLDDQSDIFFHLAIIPVQQFIHLTSFFSNSNVYSVVHFYLSFKVMKRFIVHMLHFSVVLCVSDSYTPLCGKSRMKNGQSQFESVILVNDTGITALGKECFQQEIQFTNLKMETSSNVFPACVKWFKSFCRSISDHRLCVFILGHQYVCWFQ